MKIDNTWSSNYANETDNLSARLHNSAPNFGLLCITMRKWKGEGSFACIYYGFYLWKDRDKRNFKNINRALEIQNYKCCLGNVESLPDNSRAVKDLSPLFITSLPWRFFLHLSRPFSYSCWVILIHRSSALMAGIGSWLILRPYMATDRCPPWPRESNEDKQLQHLRISFVIFL
jgi:hypothetical protein